MSKRVYNVIDDMGSILTYAVFDQSNNKKLSFLIIRRGESFIVFCLREDGFSFFLPPAVCCATPRPPKAWGAHSEYKYIDPTYGRKILFYASSHHRWQAKRPHSPIDFACQSWVVFFDESVVLYFRRTHKKIFTVTPDEIGECSITQKSILPP